MHFFNLLLDYYAFSNFCLNDYFLTLCWDLRWTGWFFSWWSTFYMAPYHSDCDFVINSVNVQDLIFFTNNFSLPLFPIVPFSSFPPVTKSCISEWDHQVQSAFPSSEQWISIYFLCVIPISCSSLFPSAIRTPEWWYTHLNHLHWLGSHRPCTYFWLLDYNDNIYMLVSLCVLDKTCSKNIINPYHFFAYHFLPLSHHFLPLSYHFLPLSHQYAILFNSLL